MTHGELNVVDDRKLVRSQIWRSAPMIAIHHAVGTYIRTFVAASSLTVAAFVCAKAQSQVGATAPPGAVIQGSPDVSVGGGGAARAGDATKEGAPVVQGSPNVFINGKPAATLGGRTGCGGAIVGGSANVFVNGKPLARTGDKTQGCAGR